MLSFLYHEKYSFQIYRNTNNKKKNKKIKKNQEKLRKTNNNQEKPRTLRKPTKNPEKPRKNKIRLKFNISQLLNEKYEKFIW